MVQIGRKGTARRLFENFKKFSKIAEFEFQNSGPSFFASVSPVYCKKIDSIRTKLTEEIDFEVCHFGNLPSIVACSAAAVDDRDVRIQKCRFRIIPRILTTDPRTGGIRTYMRNRAVKTNRLVFVFLSVCLSLCSSRF